MLAPFWHPLVVHVFWRSTFHCFLGWRFYRFLIKNVPKIEDGSFFFLTFPILFPKGCFVRSLDSSWHPIWLNFDNFWQRFGFIFVVFGACLVPLFVNFGINAPSSPESAQHLQITVHVLDSIFTDFGPKWLVRLVPHYFRQHLLHGTSLAHRRLKVESIVVCAGLFFLIR